MFDHMVEENGLRPSFSHYHLMENDVEFIKELIVGIDRDRGGDKVPKNQDCRIEEIAN